MINVFKKWMNRIFLNEEAILLIVLLAGTLVLIVNWGHILTPVIAALVVAFLLQGAVSRLTLLGVPGLAAVLFTFGASFSLFILSLIFVLPLLWEQTVNLFNEAPVMIDKLRYLALNLHESYPQLVTKETVLTGSEMARDGLQQFGEWVITSSLANIVGLASFLVYAILVPFLVFFLLKDKDLIIRWLGNFLPNERPLMHRLWDEMNEQVANYVRGKAIEIMIVGLVSYIVFQILGVNYAELLAILVGFSVIVPFIGAAAVTVPVLIVGFFQWGASPDFIYLAVAYAVIQALDGNVLVPLLFSETVNLHPVAIIIAVVFFGGVWGIWGVFFAIPLATLIKAVINAWPAAHKNEVLENE